MKTLFFSVDVETSGTSPCNGDLLSIGAVPVTEEGHVLDADSFYGRIVYDRPLRWHDSVRTWWEQQDERVREEVLGERAGGMTPRGVAVNLEAWVRHQLTATGCEHAAFVAHPASFDWMWVDAMLWEQLDRNIFGYRALCLRSMGFGLSSVPWSADRTDDPDLHVSSELKHHALYDAIAQAQQLAKMLRMRGR